MLFMASLSAQSFEGIRLSAGDWNLGAIPGNRRQTMRLTITNESGAKRKVSILPTCPCIEVPNSVELPAGRDKTVDIVFDPAGLPGPVSVLLVFLTDKPGSKGYFFRIHGSVTADESEG